ncbi:Vegetative incompatibility protein HET-E-1 [Podospora anserina] [Rhizoctonia solani]|uniref:Vegetative incompatibility protein HET-E-1 [Podospora anserina] n=1 Tax=Rhizoctonia solani TaxID=456999 RepID=A0A0K6GCW5_9AGAM|nr:Vegetative incompatibility protein HET-E-1 [Podospora anserina] [Rhizoctonia solani]
MSTPPSSSKRKRRGRPNVGDLLRPEEWSNKRSRSGSPSASGASTPGAGYSNTPAPSNLSSRGASPMGRPEPSLPSDTPMTLSNNTSGSAWTGLEQALRALRITTKICPPLSLAVNELASCLPIFEAAAKSHRDYDALATGLKDMVNQLIRHLNGTRSESIINTITDIAEAIRKEIESITMHQSHSIPRRMLGASTAEDDLIRRYRRIEQLFRQLQGEASMSTWNTVDEVRVDQQLNKLSPSNLARFNSKLSTEISRRGCTKDTRTKILEESMEWSENPDLAKVYWMNGMAGTGKTTIAYTLCEKLEARKQLAASFFCTRASPDCREAKQIIPTIAYQLARRFIPFQYSLCQQLKKDPDISTSQLNDQFELLLKKPLLAAKDKLSNNLVVVIDALDECNDPHIVELFLDLLFRSVLELPIKFFVTSRPEPAIRNKMMPESERSRSILYLHEIELSLVQADIELYLREELASIAPADSDLIELAEHAGNLFIYAATAVRYIRPVGKAVNSKARLKAILAVSMESNTTLSAIDTLYIAILTAAINDEELTPEERSQIQTVLRTVVCACEPILIRTLSTLSGLNDKDDTMAALQPLRSVLHVSEHSELVTTLHASFPDFMFNQTRSQSFYCDKAIHSQLLVEQCFNVMKAQLRFNICSIQSSFVSNNEIPGLEEQIATNISEELFYTCRFWMDHMSETNPTDTFLFLVDEFLSQRLLFWMEVMSLKNGLVIGIILLTKLNGWLAQSHLDRPGLSELASDAQAFAASYASSPASAYTSHIYLSALPLSPPSSSVRLQYWSKFKGLIKVSGTIFDRMQTTARGTWASTASIRSATFSPDGNCIIIGNEKGRISVHDAYDGKFIVQPFKAHKKLVSSIGVSRDGMQIVSGSHDMTLSVWDARDGSLVSGPFKGHTSRVTSVAFSIDGAHIASGSDDCTIGVWGARSAAAPMRSFTGHQKGVNSVAFSPNGSHIISGSADKTIRLWDLSSGATVLILNGHVSPISSVQFASNGTHVVSGSHDCTIRMWNTSDGSPFHQPLKGHSKRITTIAVSLDGDRIVSGSLDCTVCIWNTHSGELVAGPFRGHTLPVRSVGFSSDGLRIMSTSDDQTVRVWSARGHTSQINIGKDSKKGHGYHLNLTSSRSQTHVAIREKDKSTTHAHVWDLQNMTHVVIPTNAEIRHLQFSFDGTRIYSLHTSGTICSWDTQTAKLLDGPHRFTSFEAWDLAACSLDGTRVVTCHKNRVELWHIKSDRSVAFCPASYDTTNRIFFSQDGGRFVTSGYNTTDVWDGGTGARVAGPFPVHAYDFSPNGTYLCGYSPVSPKLINVNTGEQIEPCGLLYPHSQVFTPDGLYLVIESRTGIDIFGTRDQLVNCFKFQHYTLAVRDLLGYSSDGRLLLSIASRDHQNLEGLHICRVHVDHRCTVNADGWVLDDQKRPLVWVPKDIRDDFPSCDGVIISDADEVLQSVSYGGMLVGDSWSGCYISGSQNTPNVTT